MRYRALGIDVASARWPSNGSALVEWDPRRGIFTRVRAPAIAWPAEPLTPRALADAIDSFARSSSALAVALDGPQGFRDPGTPRGAPGVGRRCEHACRTQGKTGVYPRTYPSTQRRWVEFCVDLFDSLLSRRGVVLASAGTGRPLRGGYALLECFPTSAWRSSGLVPLPAKSRKVPLAPHARALAQAYGLPLPPRGVGGHDDLQAVVAALAAAAFAGGPAIPEPRGVPAGVAVDRRGVARRTEGFIWDVRPARARAPVSPGFVARASTTL